MITMKYKLELIKCTCKNGCKKCNKKGWTKLLKLKVAKTEIKTC
jgi:hypothetical protein